MPNVLTVLDQVKILAFHMGPDYTNVKFFGHCILDGKLWLALKKIDKLSAIFPRIACHMFSENNLALYALCPEK